MVGTIPLHTKGRQTTNDHQDSSLQVSPRSTTMTFPSATTKEVLGPPKQHRNRKESSWGMWKPISWSLLQEAWCMHIPLWTAKWIQRLEKGQCLWSLDNTVCTSFTLCGSRITKEQMSPFFSAWQVVMQLINLSHMHFRHLSPGLFVCRTVERSKCCSNVFDASSGERHWTQ